MLPMTTAAHKPQETVDDLIERVFDTGTMSREDAVRILAECRSTSFHEFYFDLVQQAIAVKLAGV